MTIAAPGAGLHPVGSGGQNDTGLHPVGSGGQASTAMHPVGGPSGGPGATPLMAQAIATTRDALQRDPGEATAPAALVARPVITDDLPLCEPWVRIALGASEALAGLQFDGSGGVWHAPVNLLAAGGPVVSAALSLISMKPPRPDVLPYAARPVLDAAAERSARLAEVLVQADDFWSFWAAVIGLNPARTPRTTELVAVAYHMATAVTLRLKGDLKVRRPGQISPLIQPILALPGHASMPSGHATIAYLFAEIAPVLLNLPSASPVTTQLRRLADRIAYNRVVAGLHYPMDSLAGRLLGQVLGQYFTALCNAGELKIAGSEVHLDAASDPAALAITLQPPAAALESIVDTGAPALAGGALYTPGNKSLASPTVGYSIVRRLWELARDELTSLGLRWP